MDRKQQQAELIYKLGQLLRPMQDLVDFPDQQTAQTRARASAKFAADFETYHPQILAFTRSEPGHNYDIEWRAIFNFLHNFGHQLGGFRDDTEKLQIALESARSQAMATLISIPAEADSEVLEAHSPFQAYCKLKSFFETTANRAVWADPYMGPGLFHRYLNGIPDSVQVVLVTKDRGTNGEYQSFLDISRLYATERGPTQYRLVVESTNHDRWLRTDDQLYHLGGSAKDAGKRSPFTISKLAPTPANFQLLDGLIASGIELFGLSTPTHA